MGLRLCHHAELVPCGEQTEQSQAWGLSLPSYQGMCGFTEAVAGVERLHISQLQWAGVEVPLSGHLSLATSTGR